MAKSPLLKRLRHRLRVPLIKLLFSLFPRFSLVTLHRIGRLIGWLIWLFNGEMRKISEQNIENCLPELSPIERQKLIRQSLIETGKTMLEVPFLWHGDEASFDQAIRQVHGTEVLQEALASGKGIVAFAPHLGAWEVAGLYLSKNFPMVTMYKPSHIDGLDDLIRVGRTRFGTSLAATDLTGVRQLLQGLKKGSLVGMLPDQDPGNNGGEFAPFFGIEANTMTLANKLLNKSGAIGIFCIARRLKNARGYVIQISRASDDIASNDVHKAITAMNADLEKVILQSPEQYQWSYKRFKTRPEGQATIYRS